MNLLEWFLGRIKQRQRRRLSLQKIALTSVLVVLATNSRVAIAGETLLICDHQFQIKEGTVPTGMPDLEIRFDESTGAIKYGTSRQPVKGLMNDRSLMIEMGGDSQIRILIDRMDGSWVTLMMSPDGTKILSGVKYGTCRSVADRKF